jgi:DNA repair exonuclease SbcCD nuclease subunit
MKFAHLADTHIKNLKYHYEYRKVFDQLYEILRKEKVDYIVHCGDIAHTKTQLSPEFVDMCSNFFRNLAEIAPTYVILGNHDGNLKNSSRQDAITPIVEALELDDLHLLKQSGEVHLDNNYCLNVLSIFDEDAWVEPTNVDKINIALYHGSIAGVTTDVGWVMEHGDHDVSIFEGHDFAFLGDIHKTNQILDHEGRVRYVGSTIQQNHGETNDKGILIWDIKDKDTFNVEHRLLKNPKPFITIELTPKGRLPRALTIPEGARLRLVSSNKVSVDALRKAIDIAKRRFRPEAITYLNRARNEANVEDLTNNIRIEDLRDLAVQEKLIGEYLKDYEIEEEALQKVFELNNKYNALAEESEEVSRNVKWRLKRLEWDNLFNYGGNNYIDFDSLNGTVGIFGKNYSGKSSIIDSLLYTMYNSTSKNVRKNLNVINQTKNVGSGKAEILVGNKLISIERISEKYQKRLHGEETTEAKTDVNFSSYDPVIDEIVSLNGMTRNDTDKNIRRMFGSLDDFLLTSMSSQLGSLLFISEGSTRRKEILAKFLDLEVFEKKFKIAKEDAADLKGALKRLEGREFDDEILAVTKELFVNENTTEDKKKECGKVKKTIEKTKKGIDTITASIAAIPAEVIDIIELNNELIINREELDQFRNENERLHTKLNTRERFFDKISEFLAAYNSKQLIKDSELIKEKQETSDKLYNEVCRTEEKLEREEKKTELLKEVPCGDQFPTCKFLHDAIAARKQLGSTQQVLINFCSRRSVINKDLAELDPEKVDSQLAKYNKIVDKRQETTRELTSTKLEIEKNDSQIARLELFIENMEDKAKKYEENKEAIENLEALLLEKEELKNTITANTKSLEQCEAELLDLYKNHGSLEQRVNNLESQKEELKSLREEFSAYDLYMRAMHTSGISYDIIKMQLPVINEEIAKVLTNVVNFEVFFENDSRKLNIFIKHPKYGARPLEMGSGAEKTIAAMAIRLALLNVSNLPKPNIFILDEPGTALDEENMEGFVRILDMIKGHFKTVLLISHLDNLKDCVDMQIVIDKKRGLAQVQQ